MIASARRPVKLAGQLGFFGVKNHLKNSLCLLATAAFLAGCTTAPDVTTYVDPLTNQRTDLLSENELVQPGVAQPREIIWLNGSRLPVARNKYNLYLEVTYAANVEAGPLDIYPGRTLTIIADGKEMKFAGLGSMNARKERGNILYETAHYEAQPSDFQAIANAKKVTVLVQGKSLLIEREFAPENFERFKQFAAKISAPPRPASYPTVRGY
jgi:hypothetical protein